MAALRAEGKQTRLVTVGKKATGYFRFRGYEIDDAFIGFSDEPTYEDARKVAEAVVGRFEAGEYDQVEIVTTQFISTGVQKVIAAPLRAARARHRRPRSPPARPPTTSSSRRPARSSTGSCPATRRPGSTPRCSRARPPSSPPSSER